MKSVKCPCCGAAMKRNGKTGAGSQRWRCRDCGASRTVRYDDEAARLREFVGWLLLNLNLNLNLNLPRFR